jgi:hypothetical protein
VICTTPDVSDNLVNELRTATDADIDAVMISQVNEIIKVATTSSNLRGTYIKGLKVAAGTITAGIMENVRRRTGPAGSMGVQRLAEARSSMLKEEYEALRKDLARITVSASRECSRCGVSASESGCPPRNGQNDNNAHLAALERRVEELRPSIIRAIEGCVRDGRPTPKDRSRQEPVAPARTIIDTQLPSHPREQQGGEWEVVESRKKKKNKKKAKKAIDRAAGSQVTSAPSTTGAQPDRQTNYTPKPKDAASTGTSTKTSKGASVSTPRKAVLPRSPRSSVVTLTLSEEAKISYVEALTTARGKIPLAEVGIEKMKMARP